MKTPTHEKWWDNTGSSIRPKKNEDCEEFAERITRIAFETAKSQTIEFIRAINKNPSITRFEK